MASIVRKSANHLIEFRIIEIVLIIFALNWDRGATVMLSRPIKEAIRPESASKPVTRPCRCR